MGLRKSKKLVWLVFGVLVGANFFAWLMVWELSGAENLEVVFFDIGQGDAIFIETPKRYQILIDGGPTSAVLEKLAKEMPFYDRTVDLIILSHPEKDHLFGLLEVLKRYKIKNILWTGIVRQTAEYREWKKLIQEEGAEITIARAGQKIIIQQEPLIYLDLLYPLENLEGREFKDSNDTSIVAKLIFNQNSFLFTGDITGKAEKLIIADSGLNPDSDVLKVAHHGSKTSSSPEFLEAVSPEIAIISAGENNYGHPHGQVLENLENFGIEILITKEAGDIKIISDGKNFYEQY